MQSKSFLILVVALVVVLIAESGPSMASSTHCKELNHHNCYVGKNEGNYCNKKDQTTSEVRWYYDKGACKKFAYKGCNGNRNRFCSKEVCERRCDGES